MLTSNANSSSPTLSHALQQANRSHLSGCFKCSSLLACQAPRVRLPICFTISPSRIHLTSSLYLCPADCFQDILFEQAGNSHWKKLAFLQHIKWHICSAGELKIIKVPHLMSKRPIKCWLATLNASSAIMSHALEQINAARIGVICQGASSAPHFLLARLHGYSFQFVFQLVLPAFLRYFAYAGFRLRRALVTRLLQLTSREAFEDAHAPWAHESTSLESNKANRIWSCLLYSNTHTISQMML